ncbi:MAG: hypothetical protein IJT44_02875 [Clostridia bacterium]|nr:hypothetical protein [Clostridia bacterium]
MKKVFRGVFCLCLAALVALGTCGCALLPDNAPEFQADTRTLEIGSPHKHYFELLNDTEKAAYNAVLSAVTDFPQSIEVPKMTQEELSRMYSALLYDNPTLFFLNNGTTMRQSKKRTYFYPSYRMNAEDYAAVFRRCTEVAEGIVAKANAQSTAFERERVVHDSLIALCGYSDIEGNNFKNTIYGALVGENAACEGYAKTAKYLLDLLGIPCFVVHGSSTPPGSRTQSHMWNVVQLDGEWYHLDLTWDDPVMENGGSMIRYTYFNVTDAQIKKTHADFDALVECTATADNFFVHEKLLFKSFGDAEKKRAATYASRIISDGSDGFELQFADAESYKSAQQKLFEQEEIYALLKQIAKKTSREFATDRVSYYNTDADNRIEIILEVQGGDDDEHTEN